MNQPKLILLNRVHLAHHEVPRRVEGILVNPEHIQFVAPSQVIGHGSVLVLTGRDYSIYVLEDFNKIMRMVEGL